MIRCAAVKFKIEKTGREVVLCGVRHGDCFSQMADFGLKPGEDYHEIAQGFVTNNNEFLDRTEALWHARQCGQMSVTTWWNKQDHSDTFELYSEDLW